MGKFLHGLTRLRLDEGEIGGVDGAADGVLAVLALVDNDPRAVCLEHIPVLPEYPGGDGFAAVVLRPGDLHEVALLEGNNRGHRRDGFGRDGGLLRGGSKSVQLRSSDDSGIILVGNVGIDSARDAVHAAGRGVLPHTENPGIGRCGSPLRQPMVEAGQPGIVQVVLQPVGIAVEGAVKARLLNGVTERDDHIGEDGLAEVLLRTVFKIEGDGICEYALVLLQDAHHILGFLFRGRHRGGVGVEVGSSVCVFSLSVLYISL